MTWILHSRARPARYSATAKAMHWAVAVAVIAMIPEGIAMKRLIAEGPTKESLYNVHGAVGALALIVMVARLARRLSVGVPAPDATLSPFEQGASTPIMKR